MTRERLVEMARRSIAHHNAGTTDRVDSITTLPASNYYDPERWRREVDLVFKRLPLAVAFTAELREVNSYKAMDVMGIPVLLTRAADGAVRAFVNMCSHRGAQLVDVGRGSVRRIVCPYHAWTYDPTGDLVGIFRQDDFGEIDRSCLGLTALPVAERAGIVWAVLNPKGTIDIDTFLSGLDMLVEPYRFGDMHHFRTEVLAGPNWKVALDGYVDFYHLPILHKNTFGPDFSTDAVFHKIGPHQRLTSPRQNWGKLEAMPEADWQIDDLMGGVWSIFPHGSIAGFDVDGHKVFQIARLFPGPTPGESTTHLDFLSLGEPTDDFRIAVDKQVEFLVGVVRDEDYATGLRIQRTVQTGAKKEFLFGRNEGGAQHLHRWIDAILATADEDLNELFRTGNG